MVRFSSFLSLKRTGHQLGRNPHFTLLLIGLPLFLRHLLSYFSLIFNTMWYLLHLTFCLLLHQPLQPWRFHLFFYLLILLKLTPARLNLIILLKKKTRCLHFTFHEWNGISLFSNVSAIILMLLRLLLTTAFHLKLKQQLASFRYKVHAWGWWGQFWLLA